MLQNSSMSRVAEIFFNEPTKPHYLIEISKKAKLAHTSVLSNLEGLQKISIIKKGIEIKGKRKFPIYNAEFNNKEYRKDKKLHNLSKVYNSGLIEYLGDKLTPKCIILFGSYSRGEDIEDSDLDIYIQSIKKEVDLRRFEKILGRKIELHFNENFNNYSIELKNNILNGNILYGYLEVFK